MLGCKPIVWQVIAGAMLCTGAAALVGMVVYNSLADEAMCIEQGDGNATFTKHHCPDRTIDCSEYQHHDPCEHWCHLFQNVSRAVWSYCQHLPEPPPYFPPAGR